MVGIPEIPFGKLNICIKFKIESTNYKISEYEQNFY